MSQFQAAGAPQTPQSPDQREDSKARFIRGLVATFEEYAANTRSEQRRAWTARQTEIIPASENDDDAEEC